MTREEKWLKDEAAITDLIRSLGGIAKTADLYTLGIDYRRIQTFVSNGVLKKIKNGYYILTNHDMDEDEMILKLFGADGILTMESALYTYGYIDTKPYEYQIAIDKNTSKSRFKLEYPFVHPYYAEPKVLTLGVTQIPFSIGSMKIYDKARLICDCLKYEDHMDREVLKQALFSYIQEKEKNVSNLLYYAVERGVQAKVQNRIGVWL